ncbi:MAG: hypothetical protein GY773_27570, partial [Actinomycetia bacterium]|nr:hypothetical protein [Actinomycetes bacterium]
MTEAAWLDHSQLAVAVSGGAVTVVDVDEQRITRVHPALGGRVMELLTTDGLLIANSDQLAPMILSPHWRTRAPTGVRQLRSHQGQVTTLGKRGIERWTIPETPMIEAWLGAGITSGDASKEGLLGIADGVGRATIWSTGGDQITSLEW